VDQVKQETMHNKDLIGDINKLMQDIPLNDCALPGCEHPIDPPGAKITFSREVWNLIRANTAHPLHQQATNGKQHVYVVSLPAVAKAIGMMSIHHLAMRLLLEPSR
jgi:hypothetical protein